MCVINPRRAPPRVTVVVRSVSQSVSQSVILSVTTILAPCVDSALQHRRGWSLRDVQMGFFGELIVRYFYYCGVGGHFDEI